MRELFNELHRLHVKMAVKEGNLDIQAPKGVLNAELLTRIRNHKQELIALLQDVNKRKQFAAINAAPLSEGYSMSSAQRRLWVLDQLEGTGPAYNIGGHYIFGGALKVSSLQLSLDALVQRHEILRTVFRENEAGDVLQYIQPFEPYRYKITITDLTSEPGNGEQTIAALLQAHMKVKFDLATGPLLKVILLKVSAQQWILSFVMHHIISDGWSLEIIFRELRQFYHDFSAGNTSLLPELPIQYKDYSVWQQQQLKDGAIAEARSYWLRHFAGEIPVLDLPADNIRPAIKSYNGAAVECMIPAPLVSRLNGIGEGKEITLFMRLQAAVNVLLYRYSGQQDIITGTPVAGRMHGDLEQQIGFYVNTLALRCRIDAADTFLQVIGKVKAACLGAFEHQGYPFDELVEELQLVKDTSRHMLFDVMVVLQSANMADENAGIWKGLEVKQYRSNGSAIASKFDLLFNFSFVDDALHFNLEYNTDIYTEARMQRLTGHLLHILEQVVTTPALKIAEIDLLTEIEKKELEAFSGDGLPVGVNRTIIELFEASVALYPDNNALRLDDTVLSYADVAAAVNHLAVYLRDRIEVTPGELVPVILPKNEWLIISILAILKAGAAYVPVDPDYPQERISYILEDCKSRVCINEKLLQEFRKEQETIVTEHFISACLPTDAAYVIYTSGTTGNPKGIVVEHRNVVSLLLSQCREFGIAPAENILQLSAVSFDASVEQIFIALISGACLTLVPRDHLLMEGKVPELIDTYEVTHIHAVPSLLKMIPARKYSSLKRVIAGGEICAPELAKSWREFHTFYNEYGPTETTVTSVELRCEIVHMCMDILPIGRPLDNTRVYLLDQFGQRVPVGVPGEIVIGGAGVARGYLHQPALTAEKFLEDPFHPGGRMYTTGDWGKWLPDGNIAYLGRRDSQVKVRGYRIELDEISQVARRFVTNGDVIVGVVNNLTGEAEITAYIMGLHYADLPLLQSFLAAHLPGYMLPSSYILLKQFPLLPNGKVDHKALKEAAGAASDQKTIVDPQNNVEEALRKLIAELTGKPESSVSVNANFFDLGINSLKLIRLTKAINRQYQLSINATLLFKFTTVRLLAEELNRRQQPIQDPGKALSPSANSADASADKIAIIGMACRFPQSVDYREFWKNLKSGKDLITRYTDDELKVAGVPEEKLNDPRYVKAFGQLDNKDHFDHLFFDYLYDEAEFMDPQIRLFHEECWKALEDAGYAGDTDALSIGLFAGASDNQNFRAFSFLQSGTATVDPFYLNILSDQRNIAGLVAYKLNLRGPSVYVHTACSTSLAAVHMAAESLLAGKCDLALAGGISIRTTPPSGYDYREGMIYSQDGYCRAFDKEASGTVAGEGAGVVVLKRLSQAIADKDDIYAVISGSCANNDGSGKIGYTAPGLNGQVECISQAYSHAGIDPATVTCLEAHGTGTVLGDPIEIRSLNEVFTTRHKTNYCAIGSVKTNLGHLDVAAGIAGLIKVAMGLKFREIAPSLHFTAPGEAIDFANSAFYVNTQLQPWKKENDIPLRAGVTSLGIGGTNVHIILEEAPVKLPDDRTRSHQVMVLSAKTPQALKRHMQHLAGFVADEIISLPDMAATLQTGRKHFNTRIAFSFENKEELLTCLRDERLQHAGAVISDKHKQVVFAFPGQGSQYVEMGKQLYEEEPFFQNLMDRGFSLLQKHTGTDFKAVLFAGSRDIDQTHYAQPLIFLFEYALAQLLISWDIKPQYMIGHSLGEYAAACVAGVFDVEDALLLVLKRSELMRGIASGGMVSAALSQEEAQAYLGDGIEIAAVNSSKQVVFSGAGTALTDLIRRLETAKTAFVQLSATLPFHSALLEPVLTSFEKELEKITFRSPAVTLVSTLTGEIAPDRLMTSPGYWLQQMRNPVLFEAGIAGLVETRQEFIFVEVGAGNSLSTLIKQHRSGGPMATVNVVRNRREQISDTKHLADKLGVLWKYGLNINWKAYQAQKGIRRKVNLPGYNFEKIKHTTIVSPFDSFTVPVIPAMDRIVPEKPVNTSTVASTGELTDHERKLVELYKHFFVNGQVNIHDSFFDLGGDSLRAMVLIRRIQQQFDVNLTLKEFFKYPSIKDLAAHMEQFSETQVKNTVKSKMII